MLVRHVLSLLSYAPKQYPLHSGSVIILKRKTVVNKKILPSDKTFYNIFTPILLHNIFCIIELMPSIQVYNTKQQAIYTK